MRRRERRGAGQALLLARGMAARQFPQRFHASMRFDSKAWHHPPEATHQHTTYENSNSVDARMRRWRASSSGGEAFETTLEKFKTVIPHQRRRQCRIRGFNRATWKHLVKTRWKMKNTGQERSAGSRTCAPGMNELVFERFIISCEGQSMLAPMQKYLHKKTYETVELVVRF
jgi:hypothetical protein